MKNAPLQHRLEQAVYLFFKGTLHCLPHATARRFGVGFGSLCHRLLASRRRIAEANLALALPEIDETERQRIARDSFRSFGGAIFDSVSSSRFDAVELCRRLHLEGWDHFDEAQSRGRGVLAMSAHLGTWEIAALAAGLYQGPMDVVGRPMDNPHLNRELMGQRTRFGNRTLDKHGAVRGMLKSLRAGGRVGILIDQRPHPRESILVPFFGHEALTTPVLARLSLRTGAPVVGIYGYAEPEGRYRVVVRPPIYPESVQGEGDEAVESLTLSYLRAVEEEIRRQPECWLWLHDRWRRRGPRKGK